MSIFVRTLVAVAALCATAPAAPGDDAPARSAEREQRDIAADGTVSVVVDPPRRAASMARDGDSAVAGLLAEMLEPLDAATAPKLHERPLPLLEAFERSGDRARRLWIAQAYWKTMAAFATLRQSATEVERLELVAPGAAPQDRLVLDALVEEARSQRSAAQAAVLTAQQELVDLVRLPAGEPLPWPVDRPLVIPYQTHFETIFAARPATGRVRAIHRTLPARQEAIESRARAVRAAAAAFAGVEEEYARGRLPVDSVAAAAERLGVQERRFIDDVRTYNNEIAEYVMAVADFSVPDDRFAAMLIGTPTPWRQQPVVIPAGGTADAAAPTLPAGPPTSTPPPPAFVPQGPLPAAPTVAVPP